MWQVSSVGRAEDKIRLTFGKTGDKLSITYQSGNEVFPEICSTL